MEKKNALARLKDENSKYQREVNLFESSLTLEQAQTQLNE
jgi:hypothetical protein